MDNIKTKLAAIRAVMDQADDGVMSYAPDSPWQVDDRAWFAAHAERGYRLRRPYDGESGIRPGQKPAFVLVRRVIDGVRGKQSVHPIGVHPAHLALFCSDDEPVADTALALLWEAIRTGSRVPASSLVAQAHALHSATRQ
jgi:hypothetical protein